MKYQGKKLREISFPIGGIGTGSIGLAGNGQLIDWEIFNRPAKGSLNGFSHFAVKAVTKDKKVYAKVLNGDVQKDLVGQYTKKIFSGYGYGPSNMTMAGFPHFTECEFEGEFPFANISFGAEDFPGKVNLFAYNPLIPLDDFNSSLPAAFFEAEVENTSSETLDYSVAFSVMNPFLKTKNTKVSGEGLEMVKLSSDGFSEDDIHFGDLTIATDAPKSLAQSAWYRGGWNDGIATYWNEFSSAEDMKDRSYEEGGERDMATVVGKVTLAPGEKGKVRFLLSWNIPNNYNYWNPLKDDEGKDVTWKNYYATEFSDSVATARYAFEKWEELYIKTKTYKDALFTSTLDSAVIDAAASTISVIKSPTVLRLSDGSFYGWEGVHEEEGSCEGTCSHVWNYAYAVPFLFPQLERSIRKNEFTYNVSAVNEMRFRMPLPPTREADWFRACVDGQMGSVLKVYREWKISGDKNWLREQWESVKGILEYAWSPDNKDEWDKNKDGVLEGRQHHTLDMELFGPSSWLQGFYLAALKAAAEMAEYLGEDKKAKEYREIFQKGYDWTDKNLFNGKYFIQKVDLKDKSILEHFDCMNYWNEEAEELKYQIGDGSEIDQLCAQWHANILGLGDIFDHEKVKIALKNLYKNNFKKSMREFANPWRIFALNDESGAIICDYPEGAKKPAIPIPYCEEAMHGFEYQLAGLLASEGMIEEALSIVHSVRDRYDGEKRNPWNEIECGSNYARSMASFALLPILSGFTFDMPKKSIGFNPKVNKDYFKCLWSLDAAWGTVEITQDATTLSILGGSLSLNEINLPFMKTVSSVSIDGKELAKEFSNGTLILSGETIEKTLIISK